jgi:hypothetical protein
MWGGNMHGRPGTSPPHDTSVTENFIGLTSFACATGPLGPFYPATTNLINVGSRTREAVGLYHFTVRAAPNLKEGEDSPATVDPGFHYVATGPDPAGLVGQWRLDEGAGSTAADSSGLGHTLTLYHGPTWTTGPEGRGALQCDGVNDHGRAADTPALRLAGDFTISFWMKKHAEAADWSRLVGKGDVSLRNYGVWEEYGGGARLLVQQYNASGVPVLNLYSTTGLALHTWYHVVVVREGAAVRLYLNGVLDAAGTAAGAAATSTHPFTLAYAGYHTFFPGTLDDVRLYHRALSPVEVPQLHRGVPRDTDGDGLADWEEDGNGNGIMDNGETNPATPISRPATGKLDSELAARVPEVILWGYTNSAHLQYAVAHAPDATFQMKWSSWWRGWAKRIGDYTRLNPSDGWVRRGEDYDWPLVRPGTWTTWQEDANGSRESWVLSTTVDYPPSVAFPIPGERCAAGSFTHPTTGDVYTRSAQTAVRLTGGGGSWPKSTKSVLLTVQAVDKSDGSAVPWAAHQYTLAEPSTTWQGVEIDPASREIRVAGRLADANGHVLVEVPRAGHKDVTPEIAGCAWYRFELAPALPWPVRMSWSHHPLASPVSPQAKFDDGAVMLAQDDDQRIKNPTAPNDDVPVYVEFFIIPAQARTFPGAWGTNPDYNEITSEQRVRQLLQQTFANVKQVTLMVWEVNGQLQVFGGWAAVNTPSLVLMANAPAETVIHEWGHTAGCPDRDDLPEAVMYKWYLGPGTHREVNCNEASLMQGWNLPFWP